MIPVGALVGGLTVTIVDAVASREVALRAPWLLGAIGHLLLLVVAIPQLTTKRLDGARDGAAEAAPAPV
jgi:hypothetical protein